MATFTNEAKSSAPSYTNESKNSASWTNDQKTNDAIGLFIGLPFGLTYAESVNTSWTNLSKS